MGISDFRPQGTPCAQLPEGSSVIQMLENPLCSPQSTFDAWLNTSSTVEPPGEVPSERQLSSTLVKSPLGRGSSHHVPSSSDQEASNSGLHLFSRLRDLCFCSITLIPECLSNTRNFPSPGQPFILATCSFLSPPCSPDETPC
ncbi:hypothetical protein Celaphus_00016984 [Cervus elaphus hippelaphus]|uniref:Uncharacterized protein n=1 Tax=Cervus elaphus hippelaphus TaxID=46360 RepID=A0A212CN06_CEREH|nr:hypothetical protein Celaphus_00016984 [Cervus elaphus hippelaphus]